jgi:multiple sugar transport system substrate-binding protein
MKKWIRSGVLLTLVSLLSLIAACESSKPITNTGTSPVPATVKKVNLKLWGAVPAEAGPQQVVDNWNAKNPNIHVEYVRYVNDDGGNLKLDTSLMTGGEVDIYVSYNVSRLDKRAKAKLAVDLSTVAGGYNFEQAVGSGIEDWKIDGKIYGIPTTESRNLVFLNKKALDEAKLPVPTDWTWDELAEYANKLKQEKRWGFVQNIGNIHFPIEAALNTVGYTKQDGTSNLDHPFMKTWLEGLNKMMKTDKSTPELGQQISTKMPVDISFLKGEAAMYLSGAQDLRSANNMKDYPRDFQIAFAPLPKLSKDLKDFKTVGGLGDAFSINPESANKAEAWQFIKWYTEEGILPMVPGGRIPVSNVIKPEMLLTSMTTGLEDKYDTESMKRIVATKSPNFTIRHPQQVIDLRREEYEKYFTGSQTLDVTLKAMAKRHTDFLNQNKK